MNYDMPKYLIQYKQTPFSFIYLDLFASVVLSAYFSTVNFSAHFCWVLFELSHLKNATTKKAS